MNFNETQDKIGRFVKQKKIETSLEIRTLDLVSEVGELAKEIIKSTNYGKKDFCQTDNFTAELGDILFSVICIANKQSIDLDVCLNNTLEKYEQRYINSQRIDSGYQTLQN